MTMHDEAQESLRIGMKWTSRGLSIKLVCNLRHPSRPSDGYRKVLPEGEGAVGNRGPNCQYSDSFTICLLADGLTSIGTKGGIALLNDGSICLYAALTEDDSIVLTSGRGMRALGRGRIGGEGGRKARGGRFAWDINY